MTKNDVIDTIKDIQDLFKDDFLKSHYRRDRLRLMLEGRDIDPEYLIDELAFEYHPNHEITLEEILEVIERIEDE